ncbi:MAG: hybrid-cluster NAD(P)-dependent oxidoreductase, partial [Polyangiales bacterium]
TLSLRSIRAEVVKVVDETADTKSIWLRPNARFGTYRPGAYVTFALRIDGQLVRRSYSVSSAPRADGLFSITVKRVTGGLASNWIADHVRVGQVLELSAPEGQFVLPERLPERLLMLSAGSGITPVMSMLRQLVAAGTGQQVTFLHFARSPRDVIFRQELEQIAQAHPNVTIAICVENAEPDAQWTGGLGRFSEEFLTEHAPEFRELDTYLCGPAGFMQAVMRCFERADADLSKLRYERFDAALDPSMFLDHAQVVRFLRSGTESISNRPRTILEEAEAAGLTVEYGCRAGNCGSCRCRKQSGVVVDVTTGLESGPNDEFIFPCISVARGTVEVDL